MSKQWRKQVMACALSLAAASAALAQGTPSTQPAATAASPATTKPAGGAETAPFGNGKGDFGEMSLEELMNVEVRSPAGLTAMDARRTPVDLTTLDSRDIQQSGAKSLNRLMEIYVPNTEFINHQSHQQHMGFRGIISDRDDKYLYQVNGVTMNNRMLVGADNERALPLLGDIYSVSVVRGPASATYGSGAVAGVIDVEAYTGLTFQGFDMKVREGLVDQYTATEVRYGKKFSETSGLFAYYGFADEQGASSKYFIGKSYPATNGLPANVAGQPADVPMPNYGEAGFDAPWQKMHVSYVNGSFEAWTRFVQDGGDARPARDIYTGVKPASMSVSEWTRGRQFKSDQFTAAGRFKMDLSADWNVELLQSYDVWWFRDQRAGTFIGNPVRNATEHQLFSRAILGWTPTEGQSLAFGTEYSHMWFHDPAQSDALDRAPALADRGWQTDTFSFLAEDQWRFNKQWTLFLSMRTDKNTYSEWLLSSRGTLVFTPTKEDTFKWMVGQSVRRGDDEELWSEWKRNSTIPKPETLRTYEISYDRQLTDAWQVGGRGFYEDYNALGWIPGQLRSGSLGRFQIAGGEAELTYKTKATRFTMSEGVSTLVESSVPGDLGAAGQGITSAPYGFGHELANWAPSITKLAVVHDINKEWSVSSSVIYYSGFPGAEDYSKYAASLAKPPSGVPLSDAGNKTPYGLNLYVNVGLEWHPTKHLTLRVDGYNLAALVDPAWSKRNYILRASEYSEEPAAVSMSAIYRF